VVDATNLRLHLRFVLEVRELGLPMVVALNMADAARGAASASTAQRWSANSACRWSKPSRCAATARRPAGGDRRAGAGLAAEAPACSRCRHPCRERAPARARGGMPRRTAHIDDALDRWLLHPVFGLLTWPW
jgi:ferrous iron transport protein B